MSTRFTATGISWVQLLKLLLFVLLAVSVVTPAHSATDEHRSSVTNHSRSRVDTVDSDTAATVDQYQPLVVEGGRDKTTQSGTARMPGAARTTPHSHLYDFWIYEADVVLFSDDDGDGYFFGIDLLIDADTLYRSADVYAAVYLSLNGGPWNEYAVTEDFTIFGESADDEYVLVTELMSGYPTGSYDLLVELFDAYDGTFLAALGPEDSSALSALPLEDFNRDAPVIDEIVVVSRGYGGGGAGAGLPVILLTVLIARLCRRRTI